MWIEALKNKKYKYIERYTDPLTNKKHKISVTLDKNTPQARNRASLILQEKINKKLNNTVEQNKTFKQVYNRFFNDWSFGKKQRTITTMLTIDNKINSYIKDDVLINKIDDFYIEQLLNSLFGRYSYGYIKMVKARLNNIFNYAIKKKIINNSPMQLVTLPKNNATIDKQRKAFNKFLTVDEFTRILNAVKKIEKKTNYSNVLTLMFLTGARFGEIVALTKDKIDFKNKTITIVGTYDILTKSVTPPKTDKSIRVIKINDVALDCIKNQMAINDLNFKTRTNDFIFVNKKETPLFVRETNTILKKASKIENIKKHVTTHYLRHSHITFLAEKGVPLNAIMHRVGHSNAKTTLEIYSHVTSDMEDKAIKELNNISF